MKIRLNTELGGHKTGDTIDVTTGVADLLTTGGVAEHAKASTTEGKNQPRRRAAS